MDVVTLCKMYSGLEEAQIQLLAKLSEQIPFAASVSRQEVIFFTMHQVERKSIIILAHDSGRGEEKSWLPPGAEVALSEMPVWAEIFNTQKPIVARQEMNWGEFAHLYIFPVVDNGGHVIAGMAFLDRDGHKDSYLLSETAYMISMVPDDKKKELYAPISYQDGCIIMDGSGTILFASPTAKHIMKLLGFDTRLVGTSVYGARIKLSMVKECLRDRVASASEESYGDVVIYQRLLPVISKGKMARAYLILEDRTQLRKSERDLHIKNSIIKEMHHRVKNHLQSVSGLLRMQSRRLEAGAAKEALIDSIHRIESISMVHALLCNYTEGYVELKRIVNELMSLLDRSLSNQELLVQMEYEGEDIVFRSDEAVYIALILNELISNAYKHAFVGKDKGHIWIRNEISEAGMCLEIADDGVGMKLSLQDKKTESLGLYIVKMLVENELEGSILFEKREEGGTIVKIQSKKGVLL